MRLCQVHRTFESRPQVVNHATRRKRKHWLSGLLWKAYAIIIYNALVVICFACYTHLSRAASREEQCMPSARETHSRFSLYGVKDDVWRDWLPDIWTRTCGSAAALTHTHTHLLWHAHRRGHTLTTHFSSCVIHTENIEFKSENSERLAM